MSSQQPQNWESWATGVEQRLVALEQKHQRSTNIHSPKFWSRAWAILGHYLAVIALIYGVFLAIGLVIGLIVLAVGFATNI